MLRHRGLNKKKLYRTVYALSRTHHMEVEDGFFLKRMLLFKCLSSPQYVQVLDHFRPRSKIVRTRLPYLSASQPGENCTGKVTGLSGCGQAAIEETAERSQQEGDGVPSPRGDRGGVEEHLLDVRREEASEKNVLSKWRHSIERTVTNHFSKMPDR